MDSLFWADFFGIWVCGISEYSDVMWEQTRRNIISDFIDNQKETRAREYKF